MAKLANLARMTTATTGGGTITLAAAVSGFLTFAQAGINDGDTVTYAIEDGTAREIGRGVYTTSGLTLTRNVLKSTNSNAAISLSGAAQVLITPAAEDFGSIITCPPAASGWIQKNFGGSTVLADIAGGGVRLTDPGPAGNTHAVRAAVRAVAGSHWTVEMHLRQHGAVAAYGISGLVGFDNTGGGYSIQGNSAYASGQSTYIMSNASTFSSNAQIGDLRFWDDRWFKLQWDGAAFKQWYSQDGSYWSLFRTAADAKLFGLANNISHIGFGFDVNNSGNADMEYALDLLSWKESSP
jgi:hypothetical protein